MNGLGLGGGAVDLVAEHDVREHGTGAELEIASLLVEDVHPGDVRREHVGRELDAPEGTIDRPGQRLGKHRLADPGDVLDQEVTLGHQADQGQSDLRVLASDDLLDVVLERGEAISERLPIACFFTQIQPKPPVSDTLAVACLPLRHGCVTPRYRRSRRAQRSGRGGAPSRKRYGDRSGRADAPRGPCSQLQASRPDRSLGQGYTLVIQRASRRLPSWEGRSS